MKSLAIVGMMFLSMGLFAQQSAKSESAVKEKDKVCVKKCDRTQKCNKMKLAPIRQVDSRKSSILTGNAHRKHPHANSKKVHVQNRRMIVPLSKKSAKVNEKM